MYILIHKEWGQKKLTSLITKIFDQRCGYSGTLMLLTIGAVRVYNIEYNMYEFPVI